MQNPLQLFLTVLSSREEVIFMLRIIANQEDGQNRRSIQHEILRGERKREELENLIYGHINETWRRIFLPKVVQKFNKIQTYYNNRTKTYFPKQGQLLCQEAITQPGLRNIVCGMQQEPLTDILKCICSLQKQRLRQELNRMQRGEREERCNRNEKLYSENLLLGEVGIRYINQIHQKYYFAAFQRSWRNVYDVLLLDDYARSLYLQGAGFKSFVGSMNAHKSDVQQVYIPIESTQEIITTRFEKLLKELMEVNVHVQRSINQYYDNHRRRKNKESHNLIKITTRNSCQVKALNLSDFGKLSAPSSRYSRTRQLKTLPPNRISDISNSFLFTTTCQFRENVEQMHQLKFMKYFKEATFSLKQKFGYTVEEQAIKLFDQVYHYESTILPINLLDQIAELSFQMEHYPQIINQIIRQLSSTGVTPQHVLKTLIITDYLLKYGCSGIIDDLKVRVYMFRNYQEYKVDYQEALYSSIRQKATNIANQLTNRKLLYREKEIAKQIKLKIQMNKQRTQSIENQNKESTPLDDILENYIFKYMDQFNDKLETWGDQINHKLDSIIDHITANGQPAQDENGYYFPESCMDEITIVSKSGNQPIDFQQMNAKAQIDLLQFEQEKQANQSSQFNQINLLD